MQSTVGKNMAQVVEESYDRMGYRGSNRKSAVKNNGQQ